MKSTFQTIILVVLGVSIVAAVFLFSGLVKLPGSSKSNEPKGNVTLWGTVDQVEMNEVLNTFNLGKKYQVTYIQKAEVDFDHDLVEAFASGAGPDLFLLPSDSVRRFGARVVKIPYASYPERTIRDTFISETNLFVDPDGLVALPFMVDPMVMYWNRSMFADAGKSVPPIYWDEFPALVSLMTEKDENGVVSKSAVALGQFDNIAHAKDIMALLIKQAGNPITERGRDNSIQVTFGASTGTSADSPAEAAMNFYSQFSDPVKPVYTWNRAMALDRNLFLAGKLGVYFGYASELFDLQGKNPNLDFDVAMIPQLHNQTSKQTFGKLSGLAISKFSQNSTTAFFAAKALTEADVQTNVSNIFLTPPIRRDLLAVPPVNPYYAVTFYNSALVASGWIDPNPTETKKIFHDMLDNILTNSLNTKNAVGNAASQMGLLLAPQ